MKIDVRHFAGPHAPEAKYDVLTALSLIAFARGGGMQVSVLRLIGLITARYNWRADELCVCQRDMARIWGVTERTAKREVRAWVEARLMVRKRVGVRGRAGAYRLDLIEIRAQAAELWPRIGPDYVERMAPRGEVPEPVAPAQAPEPVEPAPRGTWRAATGRLRRADAGMHAAWIAPLRLEADEGGVLTLRAPTRFIGHYVETRLMRPLAEAVEAEMGPRRRIIVAGP
ncbi:DnaA N-terminal domain-containing protein [Jannaschia formosa]|uniref:DnaA N-terminal domain-containing protein n=1 Tax=Jannaschia formosa TaxID=2259592 RepID=UPI000E1BABE9|nr:DnaA N-terminal domain-containing protein [Jannaschia formosa]TFL17176.1 hypothetical protein DR046_15975 [Jannaschia formosa]